MRKLALSDEILMKVDKPASYIGHEVNACVKDFDDVDINFCMCFPDSYEVGMSHLGIQIIYDMLNRREDTWCQRVYSPWTDLDAIMREENIPLFALESQRPVKDFDFLGITLQYEMCYTNVLQILDLSQIPILASERDEDCPLVIGGGPCVFNPEPIADFFDLFYIGEGETVYYEVLDTFKKAKKEGKGRVQILKLLAGIEGIYVPSFYEPSYNEDGTLKSFEPLVSEAKRIIRKQVVKDLADTYYPAKPIVPFIRPVQDRVVLEIQRGCIRGCRFCQAGMIYRPIRERDVKFLKERACEMVRNTGYEEISLSSLSSSDYTGLSELVYYLIDEMGKQRVNISLPSLRIDSFALDVMGKIQDVRKSSVTFAPEAGTQRLRNVINKGLTEDDIFSGSMDAFRLGWNQVKLYFMLGLPTETDEDVSAIAVLSDKIARQYYTLPKEQRPRKADITISTAFFVPKPFTPFQWAAQIRPDEYLRRTGVLASSLKEQLNNKSITYNWHDSQTSVLEALFARGDRRVSKLILEAYRLGCIFDSWTECFSYDKWKKAIENTGFDVDFYVTRERGGDELFPWDFIDAGVRKEFLRREYVNGLAGKVTKNCREQCSGCGAKAWECGICVNRGVKE